MKVLKILRNKMSKKQKDVAAFIGKTPQSYGLYEKGARDPDLETLKKLAEYFSVSIDYLVGYVSSDEENPFFRELLEDEKRLLEKYRELPQEAKERIRNQLEFEYGKIKSEKEDAL